MNIWIRAFVATVVGAVVLALAVPAVFAQSCAMCYQTAAAAPPHALNALRHGILILLFPPMFIFAGIIALLYQRRDMDRATVTE